MNEEDNDSIFLDLPHEWVTAILIMGAPNWEYIQPGSYRQETVRYSDVGTMDCFFADSAVTPEKLFGFVENLQALRYVDPENPVDIRKNYTPTEEDPRLLP